MKTLLNELLAQMEDKGVGYRWTDMLKGIIDVASQLDMGELQYFIEKLANELLFELSRCEHVRELSQLNIFTIRNNLIFMQMMVDRKLEMSK